MTCFLDTVVPSSVRWTEKHVRCYGGLPGARRPWAWGFLFCALLRGVVATSWGAFSGGAEMSTSRAPWVWPTSRWVPRLQGGGGERRFRVPLRGRVLQRGQACARGVHVRAEDQYVPGVFF